MKSIHTIRANTMFSGARMVHIRRGRKCFVQSRGRAAPAQRGPHLS